MHIDRTLDNGSFRCVATNTSNNYAIVTKTAVRFTIRYLTDDVKVELRSPSSAAAISPGTDVTLRCNVNGDPTPTVEWYKNGIRLFESADKMALRRKQLTIYSVTSEDNGSYSCHAISRMPSSSAGRAGGSFESDLIADSINNFPLIVDNKDAAVIEVGSCFGDTFVGLISCFPSCFFPSSLLSSSFPSCRFPSLFPSLLFLLSLLLFPPSFLPYFLSFPYSFLP